MISKQLITNTKSYFRLVHENNTSTLKYELMTEIDTPISKGCEAVYYQN